MNRALTRISVASVTGLLLLVTACTTEKGGTATPGTDTSTPGTSTTTGADKATDIDPCDLLTASEATSLGMTGAGEPGKVAGDAVCDWTASGNGGLSAGLQKGLEDLNLVGEKTIPTKVGDRDALKVEALDGGKNVCAVVISVDESSSISVIGNLKASSTDTAAACDRATKAAALMAPKLP